MHPRRTFVLAAVFTAVVWSTLPALGAPTGTAVTGVFQTPCSGSTCEAGRDSDVDHGGAVAGIIQVHVRSQSEVGLDRVELQARLGTGAWVCLRRWDVNTTTFVSHFDWDTTSWPSSCSGTFAGDDTKNGVYTLRVFALERVTGETGTSSAYAIKVNNRPTTPAWAGALTATGEEEGTPVVELRFTGSPEPDVIEYHYVRSSPDGAETEWALSATRPGGQGCDYADGTFTCYDDQFPATGFGGRYEYVLVAFRASPASQDTCALTGQSCVQSPASFPRAITLTEPPEADELTPATTEREPDRVQQGSGASSGRRPATTGGRSGSGPTYCDFYCGKYGKTLPYDQQPLQVPRDGASASSTGQNLALGDSALPEDGDRRRMMRSIAGGMMLLLAALHLARVARRA